MPENEIELPIFNLIFFALIFVCISPFCQILPEALFLFSEYSFDKFRPFFLICKFLKSKNIDF